MMDIVTKLNIKSIKVSVTIFTAIVVVIVGFCIFLIGRQPRSLLLQGVHLEFDPSLTIQSSSEGSSGRVTLVAGSGSSITVDVQEMGSDMTPEYLANRKIEEVSVLLSSGEISVQSLGKLESPFQGAYVFMSYYLTEIDGTTGEATLYLVNEYFSSFEASQGKYVTVSFLCDYDYCTNNYPYYEQIVNSLRLTEQPVSAE